MLKIITLMLCATVMFTVESIESVESTTQEKKEVTIEITSSNFGKQREFFSEFQIKVDENTYVQSVLSFNISKWEKDHKNVEVKKIVTKSAFDQNGSPMSSVLFLVMTYKYK